MMKLGDVFDSIKNGASIKQGDGERTGYPITRIETISDEVVNRERMGYAGITEILPYTDNVLESGDILMSHINSVKHLGKTAIYEKKNDEIIIHGMNLLRLKPNREILNSKYAKYYFDTYDFKKQIPRITKNSVNQSSFNVSALQGLDIPLPPLDIQQKIADILDISSAALEKRRAQIDKLDLLVKSQFFEMFGDLVTNPMGWKIKLLHELAMLKSGKNVVARNIHDKDDVYKYPCYGGNGIRGYVDKYSHEGMYPLIGRQGALCGNVQLAEGRFYPTEHAVVVNPIEEYSIIWMFYCLDYLNLNRLKTGAAQPGLNIDILNNVEIPFPPNNLQIKYENFIQIIEIQKSLLQKSLNKLEVNHQSLVQKCFAEEVF